MVKVIGKDIGPALCRAMNIPHDEVKSMVITVDAREVVTVDVTRFVTTEELGEVGTVLEQYELHHKQ